MCRALLYFCQSKKYVSYSNAMSTRFLFVITVGFFVVLALAVAAVVTVNHWNEAQKDDSLIVSSAPAVSVAPAQPPVVISTAPAPVVPAKVLAAVSETPGSGAGVTVQNSDIDQLATAVRLGDSSVSVGKEVWAKETPVAQKLLQGLCDCDQRNWLKHFVETGNEAISGSDHYYQSVQLLSKLRRGDQDLATQASH